MTKYEAHRRAAASWARRTLPPHDAIGDRIATTCLRRTTVPDRCEVGYLELVSVNPERWQPVVMGRDATWEQAFERAAIREEQERWEQEGRELAAQDAAPRSTP